MPATLRGPIRVSDLRPELIDAVELARDDETVVLKGYVEGRRCPGRVKAEVAGAIAGNPSRHPDGSVDIAGHLAQVREILLAVLKGLDEDEADLLAGDEGPSGGVAILALLGWWGAPDDEDDADPEAEAVRSITASSSPNSPPSTASGRGNS